MHEALPAVGSAHINPTHGVAAPATQDPAPLHAMATVLILSVEQVVPQPVSVP